jgi:tRNA G26 N,N-dimethylase Trm1
MTRYEIKGMADEGKCEHCGANCPKRRVYVRPIDGGEVEAWGVVCASRARGERGTATDAKHLSTFARAVDAYRAANGEASELSRVCGRYGYPYEKARGVVNVWRTSGGGASMTQSSPISAPTAVSWRAISQAMGVGSAKVLFISDSLMECEAAHAAKMQVLFSDREGNPGRDNGSFERISTYEDLQLNP